MDTDTLLAELNGEAGEEIQEEMLWGLLEPMINLAFDSLRIKSASDNLICLSGPHGHYIYNRQ
jgi:hypothetical protein